MSVQIRKATETDIEFIIEGIIAAEKSGTDILSYAQIFQLDEIEIKRIIRNIIEEEISGQEWHLPHFHILEEGNIPAACLSSWLEGKDGISSIIKAQAMAYFLGNIWKESALRLHLVSGIQIPRRPEYIQLECIYTAENYRGKGHAKTLIKHVLTEMKNSFKELKGFEIQLMANNISALHSYTQCGFVLAEEKETSDASILSLLPYHKRISLIKKSDG